MLQAKQKPQLPTRLNGLSKKTMANKKNNTNSNDALKKSGIDKLTKIGKTTSEAHISYALRHGKITKQEAAAIDPKKFGILLEPAKTTRTITLNLNTKKGGGGIGGAFGVKNK